MMLNCNTRPIEDVRREKINVTTPPITQMCTVPLINFTDPLIDSGVSIEEFIQPFNVIAMPDYHGFHRIDIFCLGCINDFSFYWFLSE